MQNDPPTTGRFLGRLFQIPLTVGRVFVDEVQKMMPDRQRSRHHEPDRPGAYDGMGYANPGTRPVEQGLLSQLQSLVALAKHPSPYVGNINFPFVATRPQEHVLAFHNEETVRLIQPQTPDAKFDFYLSSVGTLTDLYHIPIPGTHMETNVPLKFSDFSTANDWPAQQNFMPYNEPPISTRNVERNSYSKQMYRFNDRDILYTVGPSLPKITPSGSGAQFWVGSIGAIERGEGKYVGARGISVHDGSAFFPNWPADDREKVALLKNPFTVRVTTYFKFVLP